MSRLKKSCLWPGARILACWMISTGLVIACNVPVFRYALERWEPDTYEALIFHRGPLSGDEQAAVAALKPSGTEPRANLEVQQIDLDGSPPAMLEALWQQQTNATLPWVVLRYGRGGQKRPGVWSGPLTPNLAETFVGSPAQKEIVRRLMQGQTAVWVFLESGRPVPDETALDLLTDELKRLEKAITLPAPAPDDPPARTTLPLRIDFSVVRLARNNPVEQFLVHLLTGGAEQPTAALRPIVFPTFGRGRVLAALTGKELAPETIREACDFLCGPCSCEVKELNPGRDLLLAANWDAVFEGQPPPEPVAPPLVGMTQLAPAPTNRPASKAVVAATAAPDPARRMERNLLVLLALGGVLVAAATIYLKIRAGRRRD